MTSFDQGEFDFNSGSEEGYRNWRRRLEDQQRAFETRWGIILGRRVKLELRWMDRPLEGVIRLVPNTSTRDARSLRLRLGEVEFNPAEVVSMVRVDDAGE